MSSAEAVRDKHPVTALTANSRQVSGLSAAHTIYLAGGNVLLLDKNSKGAKYNTPCFWNYSADILADFFGGNSTKATSGINGALTRTQVDEKIGDSVKQFYDDTLKSARDKARPDLIKVLTYKSAAAVEWLQDVFNLDLTLVSRLGYINFSGAGKTDIDDSVAAIRTHEPTVAMTPSSPGWLSPTL